ncbi:MAG TPA: tRNA lysidine(34) synthetase TilS [Actinomycetota bacterium]|nr:tRNA lysidine(34) synthetase TilS [Actinomycetota bacterium]
MVDPGRLTPSLGGPGFALVENARASISRYSMLADGDKIVVGVSGGPDSTALLDVLVRVASTTAYEVVVAHVDHGLSERSEAVATRVAKLAAEAGLDVHVARAHGLEGPNLHARARDFRYGFFDTIARDVGASKIATGHTLDDRVETTLARLVHGGATESLAGIPPAAGTRIRPLIGARRSETRAYCTERELTFDDDPANADERFDRAAVRSLLVRAIEDRWGDGAIRAIASAADLLRDDAEGLDTLAARVYAELATGEGGVVAFPRADLIEIPRALRRRLLERAVGRVRDRSGGIEPALAALDAGKIAARFAVASGVEISLSEGEVRVSRMPS